MIVMIVRYGRVLLRTVTAFTLAHSITLSPVTLGVVDVPGPPVEARPKEQLRKAFLVRWFSGATKK